MEQLILKHIDELIPYENNPRNNEDAVQAVANSIESFGFKVPVIIDRDNVVVAGHTRLKAAKRLGMAEVPCIVADDLTEEQIRAFRLADNKVSELAEWDFSKLETELASIDFDMSAFGFEIESEDEDETSEHPDRKDLSEEEGGCFEVIVECVDEEEQERIYERLTTEGLTCRVLTL